MEDIAEKIRELVAEIGRPVRLMEVCGTHTVAIFRHGIRNILPEGISLLSGPGCPVCVTSIMDVDTAIAIARADGVILATFGDMMRVPGSNRSLNDARAEGCDVRIVYSPLDALQIAEKHRDKKVVFFATGFETTSPSVAGTVLEAGKKDIDNFYIYSVHKTVPPALRALLDSGEVRVDGFILPGHVSTVIGSRPYEFLVTDFDKPSVITGFDGPDILAGILMALRQIATGRSAVEIQYVKVVRPEGNPRARAVLDEVFGPEEAHWRGIGVIPGSGLALRPKFRRRDIRNVLSPDVHAGIEPAACSCGEILKGIKMPYECLLFGKVCTPEKPVGACMVSSEGSCSAYYKYKAVFGAGKA